MGNSIDFFVAGIPVSKGSAKSFYNKKTGKIVTMQDNNERQKPWASMISYSAQEAGCKVITGGVCLSLIFTMPRPKCHYGTGKNSSTLRPDAPHFHTKIPDLDKLIRCVKDAIKGIAYRDDSQVCRMPCVDKVYGDTPGLWIKIEEV
jgi:Holliday junction resolvase RusA-like endonuclease